MYYNTDMNPKAQKKIDEIMYETNEKVSAIVNEIRDIRFSKMDENEKQAKCDSLREQFERVMIEEEKKVEKVMEEYP
jgi:predicted glycosyltransferase